MYAISLKVGCDRFLLFLTCPISDRLRFMIGQHADMHGQCCLAWIWLVRRSRCNLLLFAQCGLPSGTLPAVLRSIYQCKLLCKRNARVVVHRSDYNFNKIFGMIWWFKKYINVLCAHIIHCCKKESHREPLCYFTVSLCSFYMYCVVFYCGMKANSSIGLRWWCRP